MMAERVRSAVGRIGVDVTGAEVGVSVGAALASDDNTPADVLRRADEAMYGVKAPGYAAGRRRRRERAHRPEQLPQSQQATGPPSSPRTGTCAR